MDEDVVVAAPSAVEEVPAVQTEARDMDPARGALVDLTPEQRTEYKKTGTLPKPEAPAASKVEPKSDKPEADAGTVTQEHTKKGKLSADERIAQLESTIEKIRRESGKERKAEPAPAVQKTETPQNYQDWRKGFKPTSWVEQYAKDNPEATYEDAQAAMSDFLDEVRGNFRQAAEQQRSQANELTTKVNEARQRYGDKFDEVLIPTRDAIVQSQQIAPVIKQLINESEVLPDLLYTLGSSQEELNKFLAMPPGKQARYVALTESLIREELEGIKTPPEPKPPVQTRTSVPRPPTEAGGRAASPEDAAVSAVKANDFRRASAEWTRQALARAKG